MIVDFHTKHIARCLTYPALQILDILNGRFDSLLRLCLKSRSISQKSCIIFVEYIIISVALWQPKMAVIFTDYAICTRALRYALSVLKDLVKCFMEYWLQLRSVIDIRSPLARCRNLNYSIDSPDVRYITSKVFMKNSQDYSFS